MKKIFSFVMFVAIFFAHPANAQTVDFLCEKLDQNMIFPYEDKFMTLAIHLMNNALGLNVTNRTAKPIIIDWNIVSYIDEHNVAQKIVLRDVTWATRTNPMQPTHIPPGTSFKEVILPASNLEMRPNFIQGGKTLHAQNLLEWPTKRNFLGEESLVLDTKSKVYQGFAKKYNGKKIGIYLPLQTEDTTSSYTFFITFNLSPIAAESDHPSDSTGSGLTWEGLRIKSIEAGSVAEKAGLKINDLIVEINGKAADEKSIKDIDARLTAGRSVMIIYERNGKQEVATLKRGNE